jgi:hypothetical protein
MLHLRALSTLSLGLTTTLFFIFLHSDWRSTCILLSLGLANALASDHFCGFS